MSSGELHEVASRIEGLGVERLGVDDICCPACEEIECDEDCPLAGIRGAAHDRGLAEYQRAGKPPVELPPPTEQEKTMTTLYRHQSFERRAVRWTGSNEAEVHALVGADFQTVAEEDRANSDDPDATAAVRSVNHGGRWRSVCDGDWIVESDGGWVRMDAEEFEPGHEPVDHPADAQDAVRQATLIEAYWKLYDRSKTELADWVARHTARLEDPDSTDEVRRTSRQKLWDINLVRHGIHGGAMVIADMLGVKACDIERPDSPPAG